MKACTSGESKEAIQEIVRMLSQLENSRKVGVEIQKVPSRYHKYFQQLKRNKLRKQTA